MMEKYVNSKKDYGLEYPPYDEESYPLMIPAFTQTVSIGFIGVFPFPHLCVSTASRIGLTSRGPGHRARSHREPPPQAHDDDGDYEAQRGIQH